MAKRPSRTVSRIRPPVAATEEGWAAPQGVITLAEQTNLFLDRIRIPENPLRLSSGMVYGEQAKYLSWEIPLEAHPDQIELLQMTDMQWGHVGCKRHRTIEYRDWVLASPHRYMLWTGDNIDAITALSVGTSQENIGTPQRQVFEFCEVWAPAAHRILGYVGGNHERRSIPTFGDLGILIATLLRVPYSNGQQLIDLHYGQHAPFRITLWHGAGGSRTKGAKAQVLDRFMQQGDSHLYLMGHLHDAMILPAWKQIRDPARRRVIYRKSFGAMSSSFMETWGTYGEVAGFASHDVMMARAVLTPDGRWELTLR